MLLNINVDVVSNFILCFFIRAECNEIGIKEGKIEKNRSMDGWMCLRPSVKLELD